MFAGPVGLIVVILVLVMAVGFWGKESQPVVKPAEPAAEQPKQSQPAAEQPKPTTPAQQQTPPKTGTEPAQPDNAALLAQRRHIDRSGGAAKTMLATVYYTDGLTADPSLQPVEVLIPQTNSVIQEVAELVIAAPTNLKLFSSVPAGTKVNSVNLKNKVAIVDLSAEAGNVQGTEAAMNMRASLVYSLTSLTGVEAVELRINGKPALLHEIEWSQPISRKQLDERGTYKVEPVIKFVP